MTHSLKDYPAGFPDALNYHIALGEIEKAQEYAAALAEIERLREALEFYADPINYDVFADGEYLGVVSSRVEKDEGFKAQQALSANKGGRMKQQYVYAVIFNITFGNYCPLQGVYASMRDALKIAESYANKWGMPYDGDAFFSNDEGSIEVKKVRIKEQKK